MNTSATNSNAAAHAAPKHEQTLVDLTRVIEQAESLLDTLGEEGSEVIDTVRKRVMRTMNQAKSRLADSGEAVREATTATTKRADEYVHENPWKSVAVAAGVGALVALLISSQLRHNQ